MRLSSCCEGARLAQRPFAVLIMDEQMPGVDGVTFGARVKAMPAFAGVQIILLTSLDRQRELKSLEDRGFAGYLTKPVRRRELLSCVERVLERGWELATGRFSPMVTRGSLADKQDMDATAATSSSPKTIR